MNEKLGFHACVYNVLCAIYIFNPTQRLNWNYHISSLAGNMSIVLFAELLLKTDVLMNDVPLCSQFFWSAK